jgi:hypothetical protein
VAEKKKLGKAGKPPKNPPDDVKAIQAKIDAYFDDLSDKEEEPTYSGLAYALGYSSRTSIHEKITANIPISEPIKRAMFRIDISYEKDLRKTACTGAIFALKNRGWVDKQDVELSGKNGTPVKFEFVKPNESTE